MDSDNSWIPLKDIQFFILSLPLKVKSEEIPSILSYQMASLHPGNLDQLEYRFILQKTAVENLAYVVLGDQEKLGELDQEKQLRLPWPIKIKDQRSVLVCRQIQDRWVFLHYLHGFLRDSLFLTGWEKEDWSVLGLAEHFDNSEIEAVFLSEPKNDQSSLGPVYPLVDFPWEEKSFPQFFPIQKENSPLSFLRPILFVTFGLCLWALFLFSGFSRDQERLADLKRTHRILSGTFFSMQEELKDFQESLEYMHKLRGEYRIPPIFILEEIYEKAGTMITIEHFSLRNNQFQIHGFTSNALSVHEKLISSNLWTRVEMPSVRTASGKEYFRITGEIKRP